MSKQQLEGVTFLVHYAGDTETSPRKLSTVRKLVRQLGRDWDEALTEMLKPRGLKLDPFTDGLYGIIAFAGSDLKSNRRYSLYAAVTRLELEPRVDLFVDHAGSMATLRNNVYWKMRPCIITDSSKQIVDSNQIDVAHN
jgi:hypothetical protein